MGIEFQNFHEARNENNLHLSEIKDQLRKDTKGELGELRKQISQDLIKVLWSDEGLVIKWTQGKDQLGYINTLTEKWNKIKRTNQREADSILAWDRIKIEEQDWKKVLTKIRIKDWKKIVVWDIHGFSKANSYPEDEQLRA